MNTSDMQTARMMTNIDLHSDRLQVAKSKRPAVDNSDQATHARGES
jgi:hypothetical protein